LCQNQSPNASPNARGRHDTGCLLPNASNKLPHHRNLPSARAAPVPAAAAAATTTAAAAAAATTITAAPSAATAAGSRLQETPT